jgi:uncharacterized membrane protein YvbJ
MTSIYCSNCGDQNDAGNFCQKCGSALAKIGPNLSPQVSQTVIVTNSSSQENKNNSFAVSSFVTSLFGLSLLAIIFGHVALHQIDKSNQSGRGLAVAGLAIGYAGFAAEFFFWAAFAASMAGTY